jgi:hypothetical protein
MLLSREKPERDLNALVSWTDTTLSQERQYFSSTI